MGSDKKDDLIWWGLSLAVCAVLGVTAAVTVTVLWGGNVIGWAVGLSGVFWISAVWSAFHESDAKSEAES